MGEGGGGDEDEGEGEQHDGSAGEPAGRPSARETPRPERDRGRREEHLGARVPEPERGPAEVLERYGVELVRHLSAETSLATSEGTLYPLLSRLRRAGLVTTSWQESTAGPPRRYYAITPDGRAALTYFKAEWVEFRSAVDRIVGTEPR